MDQIIQGQVAEDRPQLEIILLQMVLAVMVVLELQQIFLLLLSLKQEAEVVDVGILELVEQEPQAEVMDPLLLEQMALQHRPIVALVVAEAVVTLTMVAMVVQASW